MRRVAFLRGINLGNRRLTMDELQGHVEASGLDDVATYQASGNVVFDDPGAKSSVLERRLEAHLERTLGYPVATFVRSLAELRDVVSAEAWREREEVGFRPQVIFLRTDADPEVEEALARLEGPDDRFRILGREIV